MIAGQRIHVGSRFAGRTVVVEATDATFRVHDGDQLIAEVAPPPPSPSPGSRSANPSLHDHVGYPPPAKMITEPGHESARTPTSRVPCDPKPDA
jgi:hypothetical protein